MAIEPNTVVKLYENIPWSKDKLDFRYFKTFDERNAYFNTTKQARWTITNFSYLRHEEGHPIAIPIGTSGYDAQSGDTIPTTYSQVLHCNYVFYQNSNYKERWFGGFITDVKYVNDGTVWVYFEEDIFQNWFPYITIDSGFIERETVDDDTVGKHRLDEGFRGNYVVTQKAHGAFLDVTNLVPVIFATEPPLVQVKDDFVGINVKTSTYFNCTGVGFLNGWQTPLYCVYPKSDVYYSNTLSAAIADLASWVAAYAAKDTSVIAIRMFPHSVFDDVIPMKIGSETGERWVVGSPGSGVPYNFTVGDRVARATESAVPLTLAGSGYRNNKLKTAPYVKMRAVFNGSESEYAYENFVSTPSFRISVSIGIDSDYSCKAMGYCSYNEPSNGANNNSGCLVYEMRSNGAPAFGWTKDSYSQWYAYNNVHYRGFKAATNLITGAITGVSGTSLNPVSGMTSALYGIPDLIMEGFQADREPDKVGELGYSGTTWANNDGGLNTYCMSFNSDLLHSIDNYFSMFGYKVNRVGKPNLTSRKNWNYVKTRNVHCSGVVPQYAIEFIENALDAGCTFWHKNTVGDYGDLSNPIV